MRKKLFAVIMSAMMMITFMPTMAFAGFPSGDYTGTVTDWQDYSKATVEFNRSTPTVDSYTKDIDVIRTASVDSTDPTNVKFNGYIDARVKGYNHASASASYYDLAAASVTEISGQPLPSNGRISLETAKGMFGANFDKTVDVTEVTFGVPSYVSNAKNVWKEASGATSPDQTFADMTAEYSKNALTNAGFEFKLMAPAFDSSKIYTENQTFELTVLASYDKDDDGEYVRFINSLPTVKITILKETVKLLDFNENSYIFKDKFNEIYDGSEHTLEQIDVPGFTSTYELYNNKTGKYEAVDAIKVKNATTYGVRATVKQASDGKTKVIPFTKGVQKANKLAFGFKSSENKVVGKVDPAKYVTVNFVSENAAENKKSSKKAVAKDKTALLAFLAEAYDVELEDNGNGTYDAKIVEKEATDFAAAKTKYAELLGNYGVFSVVADTAKFEVVGSIDFTKAPLAKTFKAKKGKLAKNKTFKITAKASNGATLVYKLTKGAGKIVINKATGKVTVKKGLKKGTYKVGVHAIDIDTLDQLVPAENSYTLKIKVK